MTLALADGCGSFIMRGLSIADQHHIDADANPNLHLALLWMRIRILPVTLMRIRIRILISIKDSKPWKGAQMGSVFIDFGSSSAN
jgi:hypothetical protein